MPRALFINDIYLKMKKRSIILSQLAIAGSLSTMAQQDIVHVPNIHFRATVLTVADKNMNGKIQVSEVKSLKNLTVFAFDSEGNKDKAYQANIL